MVAREEIENEVSLWRALHISVRQHFTTRGKNLEEGEEGALDQKRYKKGRGGVGVQKGYVAGGSSIPSDCTHKKDCAQTSQRRRGGGKAGPSRQTRIGTEPENFISGRMVATKKKKNKKHKNKNKNQKN